MNSSIRLISSGFQFIDKNWGGIYRGGSYLIVGPRKSGRTLLGLKFASESAKSGEVCLYFTNMRPKDLMIQAASLNFDIQEYMNQNLIIVVRVAPPNDVYDQPNADFMLIDYFKDILTVVDQYNPNRIVFDELTPYIGFRNPNILRDTFLDTLEVIEERDITSLFIVGEPATQKAEILVNTVADYVTAKIKLKKSSTKFENQFHGGTIFISPNVGHTEGEFTFQYRIEPLNGVTVVEHKKETPAISETAAPTIQRPVINKTVSPTPVSSPEIFNNVYNYSDFLLILNNQIALYKSTGQKFTLLSFKLDPAAQVKGIISLGELQNAIKLSMERKDKICFYENAILVLIVRSSPESVRNLITRMMENLPSADETYLLTVKNFIQVIETEASDNVNDAQSLTASILPLDTVNLSKYVPLTQFTG
ncbi:MAG: hypothetical protein GXO87_13450 [Chlorobi bacterium]|nr:hypothetical protein [Chlorobiota bacterium]